MVQAESLVPLLFLGGSIGMLTAEFVGVYYQLDPAHYQSFILVGMGAFYAGVASPYRCHDYDLRNDWKLCVTSTSYALLYPSCIVI